MEKKKIVIYIISIAIVLVAVFLSQQAYSRVIGKNLISDATDQASAYLAKGANWATSKIFPKIDGGVQSGGEAINNTVDAAKKIPENISQSVGKKIENYFSNLGNSIVGKENNNCKPTAP